MEENMMSKKFLVALLLAIVIGTNAVVAQESPQEDRYNQWVEKNLKWTHGLFFDIGLLYNYEYLKPTPEFVAHNLLLEIGGGYDFEIMTAKIYGDFGFLLQGDAYWSNGTYPILDTLDPSYGKFGLEAAFKLVNTQFFDLLLPVSFIFSTTKYTQKNPSYTTSGNPYDRVWEFTYTSIASGLNATFKLHEHLKLCIFSSIGYPLAKNLEYKDILQGNYVWSGINSSTYSVNSDVDVFMFSAGLGIRVNF
jgi:hypothetical protein